MGSSERGVAFLRGINVGGHRVTGPELVEIFVAAGCVDVASFLASGNVVFGHDASLDRALGEKLEDALVASLGYAVPVILRSSGQVMVLAAVTPFDESALARSTGKPQIIMCLNEPSEAAVATLTHLGLENDLLFVEGDNVFWLPCAGVLKSELDLGAVEKLIGPTTMRTKNTVDRVAKKYLS